MDAEVCVRVAEENDLALMVPLINQAFLVESFFIRGDRIDLDQLREHLRKGVLYVAELSGTIVGVIYVELRGERAYFGLLSVAPEFQGRGIARRLITAVEDYARQHACTHMDITVVDLRTELLPLYNHLGYVEILRGPIRPEMESKVTQPCQFVHMAKRL